MSGRLLAGVVGLLGVTWVAAGAHAQADPPAPERPITLRWRAPDECPTETELRERVDQLLAGAPAGRAMDADVEVTRSDQGFTMKLRLVDDAGEGERELSGGSCDEVAEATALVIALAYDPATVAANQAKAAEGGGAPTTPVDGAGADGVAPTSPTPPEPEPKQGEPQILPIAPIVPMPPPAPVPFAPPRLVPAPPEPEEELRFVVAPSVGLELGTLPGAAAFVGGGVGLRYFPFEAQIRASYLVSVSESVPDRPAAGGEFDRWALGPTLCLVPFRTERRKARRVGGVRLGTCVSLELGQMRAEGFGVANPGEGSALWVAPWAEGRASITLLEWLEVEPNVAFGFPLVRPDFVLSSVGIVHRAGAVVGRLALDVAVVF